MVTVASKKKRKMYYIMVNGCKTYVLPICPPPPTRPPRRRGGGPRSQDEGRSWVAIALGVVKRKGPGRSASRLPCGSREVNAPCGRCLPARCAPPPPPAARRG